MAGLKHIHRLPNGDAGTMATLKRMRSLVLESMLQPSVRNLALEIISQSRARDLSGQALAIRQWAGEHFQFVRDPVGVELLRSPTSMAQLIQSKGSLQGDCDDAAVLTAALARAVGMRSKFMAIAFQDASAPFTHVYSWLWTHEGWKDMDITRTQAGTTNFGPKRTMELEV